MSHWATLFDLLTRGLGNCALVEHGIVHVLVPGDQLRNVSWRRANHTPHLGANDLLQLDGDVERNGDQEAEQVREREKIDQDEQRLRARRAALRGLDAGWPCCARGCVLQKQRPEGDGFEVVQVERADGHRDHDQVQRKEEGQEEVEPPLDTRELVRRLWGAISRSSKHNAANVLLVQQQLRVAARASERSPHCATCTHFPVYATSPYTNGVFLSFEPL